eukprot:1954078-Rhodomonas_salina.1
MVSYLMTLVLSAPATLLPTAPLPTGAPPPPPLPLPRLRCLLRSPISSSRKAARGTLRHVINMLVIQMSRGTWRPKWRNQAPIQPARPQPEPPDVEELRVADVELEQQQHDVDMSNEDDNVDQRRGVEDREDDDPEGGRCNDSDDQRIAEPRILRSILKQQPTAAAARSTGQPRVLWPSDDDTHCAVVRDVDRNTLMHAEGRKKGREADSDMRRSIRISESSKSQTVTQRPGSGSGQRLPVTVTVRSEAEKLAELHDQEYWREVWDSQTKRGPLIERTKLQWFERQKHRAAFRAAAEAEEAAAAVEANEAEALAAARHVCSEEEENEVEAGGSSSSGRKRKRDQ